MRKPLRKVSPGETLVQSQGKSSQLKQVAVWALGNRRVPFEQWLPMVGGITLFTVFFFKFFPSTEGAGERLLGWLCTHGLCGP